MSFGKVSKAVASVLVAVDAAAAAAAASSVAAIAEMESEVAVLAFLTGGSVASSTELTPAPDTCAASEGGAFSTDADAAAAAAAAAAASAAASAAAVSAAAAFATAVSRFVFSSTAKAGKSDRRNVVTRCCNSPTRTTIFSLYS